MIKNGQNQIEQYRHQIKELESEMHEMRDANEKEIHELSVMFLPNFNQIKQIIKNDFVKNQSENFRLQKEITLLNRDKLNLEQDIYKSL